MNFFKLYVGDYQRDTAHLSVTEHGAYLLMLQHYYATEKPLPTGKALHRMLRAQSKTERDAIDAVVEQFWTVMPDGLLCNTRADGEIAKAHAQAETNRTIAVAREAKRKQARSKDESQHEPCTNRGTNGQPNHSHSQTPDKEEGRATTPVAVREPVSVEGHKPSHAGLICRAMKAKGIHDVNPGHPLLMQLIAQGASDVEFEGAALDAANRGKGFAYALAALQGRRRDAATVTLSDPVPAKPEAPSVSPSIEATRRLLAEQAAVVATKPPAELLQRLRGIAGAVKP